MNYKNAGINDVDEAIARLERGDVFHYTTYTIFYDGDQILRGCSPYRTSSLAHVSESLGVSGLWDYVTDWEVEKPWTDELSATNPILCRVMINTSQSEILKQIVSFDGFRYTDNFGECYDIATPIRPEECWGYEK